LENIDNEGTTLNNFARNAFDASFDGFSLILVDAPPMNAEAQAMRETFGAEADKMLNSRPFWRLYTAANVINWHYAANPVTNIKELQMLVLREVSEQIADDFKHGHVTRYRVLSKSGAVVVWRLFEEIKNERGEKEFIVIGQGFIENVTQIPAAFVGCVTDEPKLLIETDLEILIFDKESSYNQLERQHTPVFWTKGFEEGKSLLVIGATTWLDLPENGDVGYAQTDSTGMETLKATIREKKDEIKGCISQMVNVTRTVDITATETATADKDSRARLIVWAEELKEALDLALQYMGQMAGLGDDAAGAVELMTAWKRVERAHEEAKAEEKRRYDLDNTIITDEA
jgi:hypothetical protein